ncbi:MAG: hypothetical protein IPO09_10180 [Anaeromyxobacter sp.]|nr:hypothetical protein [Anaeromyxobacter sp.]
MPRPRGEQLHQRPTNSATDLTFANATAANLGGIIPGIVQNTAPTADTCTTDRHGASFTVAQQGVTTTWSWNTGVAVACNSCHASPPTDPVHTSVPKPSAATVCVACHASVVNAGGTIVFTGTGVAATTLHIDGTRQTSTATCYSCHGTLAAGNAAPPVATNGNTLTTQPKVGAHQKHLTGTALRSTAIACAQCHTVPTLMNHATGSPNVAWGTLATGSATVIPTPAAGAVAAAWETTPTCTNYCHGGKWAANANYLGATPAPTWTGTAAMVACDDCHRAPPTSSAHVGVTSTKNCQDCHPGYNCTTGSMATCTVNAANHSTGAYEPAVTTCRSCHGSATNFAPPLATNGSTTGVKVGGHQAHLVGTTQRATAMACGDCHTVPTLQTHSNAVVGFTWNALATTGGLVPTPSAATGLGAATTPTLTTWEATPTCTNYCHGQKWAADAVYRGTITAPNWNSGVTQQACGTCHRVAPNNTNHTAANAGTQNCSACHTGYACLVTNLAACTVNKTIHINGVGEATGGSCIVCHATTAGARRPIVPEFALAWSHKRSAAGAVTNFDCAVCHMEGDPATGNAVSGVHQNGVINLRDPDLGTEIVNVTYTAATATTPGSYGVGTGVLNMVDFSRNLASNVLEPAVQAIMVNQCLSAMTPTAPTARWRGCRAGRRRSRSTPPSRARPTPARA